LSVLQPASIHKKFKSRNRISEVFFDVLYSYLSVKEDC